METNESTTTTTPSTATTPQSTPAVTAPTQASPVPAATPVVPAEKTPAAVAEGSQPGTGDGYAGTFGESTEYQSTGNENLDTVLKWAGGLGLDIDTCPEMQAASKGNFGPIKALLASKQVPGADAYIALAESGYKEAVAAMEAKTQAVQAVVVEAAGSEEQWAEVFGWASENASQEEKDMINAAFDKGGFVAEAVARTLVDNYRQLTGASVPPQASPVKTTAGAQPPSSGHGPLSAKEYTQEVQKLRRSMNGRSIEGTREYQALQQRRMRHG